MHGCETMTEYMTLGCPDCGSVSSLTNRPRYRSPKSKQVPSYTWNLIPRSVYFNVKEELADGWKIRDAIGYNDTLIHKSRRNTVEIWYDFVLEKNGNISYSDWFFRKKSRKTNEVLPSSLIAADSRVIRCSTCGKLYLVNGNSISEIIE